MKISNESHLATLPHSHFAKLDSLCSNGGQFVMEEIWKDVVGYEEFYQISSFGRIRSKDRTIPTFGGKTFIKKGMVLRTNIDRYGYIKISVKIKNKSYTLSIHRLIAQVFVANPNNKPMVNHINGIKTDNRIDNLEWCTNKENLQHASKMGLLKLKKKKRSPKLTEQNVREIRHLKKLGVLSKTITAKFGVGERCILHIVKRETWADVI